MQILCSFAETTYTPSGDENFVSMNASALSEETTYTPSGDENASR